MEGYEFNQFDHFEINSIDEIRERLKPHGCEIALIKALPKNANDKNQIYIHSDAALLNSLFDLTFCDRDESTSQTKRSSKPGSRIPQAIFNQFYWLDTDSNLSEAKSCKAIIYTQYPEARISGLRTVDNEMPRSLSIEYTHEITPLLPRYLILGATPQGKAIALVVVNPSNDFINEFKELDKYWGSSVCKAFSIDQMQSGTEQLTQILKEKVAGQTLTGCRFDREGNTIPFKGTQVHGYTLEHACGITPNSDKNGDIFGIELKCFTRKKLTLFTPEPDGGLYKESFPQFMEKYGYKNGDDYRVTGLHRANSEQSKTGLTLKIYCSYADKGATATRRAYDPDISITKQMMDMEVVLEDGQSNIAASWSIERLMNCWGAKHNEVVYVPAEKLGNTNEQEVTDGYEYKIKFSDTVLWCKNTTIENLIKAIHNGTIYLDPAHKYCPSNLKNNKRRSQWRINDIYKAANVLYAEAKIKDLTK